MSLLEKTRSRTARPTGVWLAVCLIASVLIAACSRLEKTEPSPYFAEPVPPAKQELRWSNGRLPKSFDPALAESAPESDVVRAVYRGLASIDPKTLTAVPAVAEKWWTSD